MLTGVIREARPRVLRRAAALAAFVGGCATPEATRPVLMTPAVTPAAASRPLTPAPRPLSGGRVVPASFQTAVGSDRPGATPVSNGPLGVDDYVQMAIGQNPRLARAAIAIDAAQGRRVQAGLYPNPELAVTWDEIGDRTAAGGILTAPKITQTIVTGRKLTLSQAVAAREVDQTTLDLVSERYAVVGSVRAAFYDALALQRRAEILAELLKLADAATSNGKVLLDAKQLARLDYIQLEVERERFRAEFQSVQRELPGAYRRLAAVAGNQSLVSTAVRGTLEGLPDYDLEGVREAVLASHPQVRSARVGVEKAQTAIRRAEAEPIPNVSVYGGFIRQFENRSYDGAVGVSMPVPVWNRNQGNIHAAKAELGMAIQAVGQAENELAARVAIAFQTYAAARERAAVYQKELIPRAEETYRLSMAAFKGGQFEYLRVIQAQRAAAEARLEYNKSIGEAWRAAAELSGLLLEESWPAAPPRTGPRAGPVLMPTPGKDRAP